MEKSEIIAGEKIESLSKDVHLITRMTKVLKDKIKALTYEGEGESDERGQFRLRIGSIKTAVKKDIDAILITIGISCGVVPGSVAIWATNGGHLGAEVITALGGGMAIAGWIIKGVRLRQEAQLNGARA